MGSDTPQAGQNFTDAGRARTCGLEFHGAVGPEFRRLAQAAYESLRPSVRDYLHAQGVRFAAGQIQSDIVKLDESVGAVKDVRDRSHPNQDEAIFYAAHEVIGIAEYFHVVASVPVHTDRPDVENFDADGPWTRTAVRRVTTNLANAMYHALDKRLGDVSQSAEFSEAYRKDVQGLGGVDAGCDMGWDYFLSEGGAGQRQVFAAAGEAMQGLEKDSLRKGEYQHFAESFPNSFAWVNTFVAKLDAVYSELVTTSQKVTAKSPGL